MGIKRFFGLALLLVAVLAALGLDQLGRDHYPRDYTVDFTSGTNLSPAGARRIEQIAAAMDREPAYTAVIVGHTGTRGDPDANQALGLSRAEAVAAALRDAGIAADRLQARSVGGTEPLERREGEGERGYRGRLSRAEVRLRP